MRRPLVIVGVCVAQACFAFPDVSNLGSGASDAGIADATLASPLFRSSSSATINDSSITTKLPSGILAGDFLLASLYTNYAATSVATPVGWTSLDDISNPANTANFHAWWFWKIASASEVSPITITFSQMTTSAILVAAYSGASAAPIDGQNVQLLSGSPFVTPGLSVSKGATRVIVSIVDDGGYGATWMSMPPLTLQASIGYVFVGDLTAPAGMVSAQTATASQDGNAAVALIGITAQ